MRGGTGSLRKRSSSRWTSYDPSGHAVRDDSPAASKAALRPTQSHRSGTARSQRRPVPPAAQGRYPPDRRYGPQEVPYQDWRVPGGLRRDRARREDSRGIHAWAGLSMIRKHEWWTPLGDDWGSFGSDPGTWARIRPFI